MSIQRFKEMKYSQRSDFLQLCHFALKHQNFFLQNCLFLQVGLFFFCPYFSIWVLQSTLAISNMRYPEHFSWSLQHLRSTSLYNVSLSQTLLSTTMFLVNRKNCSRYLELFRRCSSQKPIHYNCVFERVCLIKCYFN